MCVGCKKKGRGTNARSKPSVSQSGPPPPATPATHATPARPAFTVGDCVWDADREPGEDSDDEPDWVESCFDPSPAGIDTPDPIPDRRKSFRGATSRNELRAHVRDRGDLRAATAERFTYTRPAAAKQDTGRRVRATAPSRAPTNGECERPGVFDPAWFRAEILPLMSCAKTMGCPGKMDGEDVVHQRLPSGPMVFATSCTVCGAPHAFNTMGRLGKVVPREPCANVQEVRDCVVTVLSQGTSQQARARDFARGAEEALVMPAPAWKRFYEVALPALERVHADTFALVRRLVATLGGKIVAGDGNWVSFLRLRAR